MQITITNAQIMIEALRAGIERAMTSGKHEFEIAPVLQSADDAARRHLEQVVAAARNTGA